MNAQARSTRPPKSAAALARMPARAALDDADAFIAAASDADLELALRLVAWNPRDLGHFLKARAPR
jgi:hypothetical protein